MCTYIYFYILCFICIFVCVHLYVSVVYILEVYSRMCSYAYLCIHTCLLFVYVHVYIYVCTNVVPAITMASRVTDCRKGDSKIKVKQGWAVEHWGGGEVEKLTQGVVWKIGEIWGLTWKRNIWKIHVEIYSYNPI